MDPDHILFIGYLNDVKRFLENYPEELGVFGHTEEMSNQIVLALGCNQTRTSPYTVVYSNK